MSLTPFCLFSSLLLPSSELSSPSPRVGSPCTLKTELLLSGSCFSRKYGVWTVWWLTLSWPEVPILLNPPKYLLLLSQERKVGGWASRNCSDPGDETAVLGGELLGRTGTGWGAGGSSCRGEALGWERGALVPGVALPSVIWTRSPPGGAFLCDRRGLDRCPLRSDLEEMPD